MFDPSTVEFWRDATDKEVVSLRVPKRLWQEVKEISKKNGWTATLAVEIALAELARNTSPQKKNKPKK